MTPPRYQQIKEIFHSVIELPRPEQAALLDRYCSDDPDLRREVEALIAAHGQAGDSIEKLAAEVAVNMPAGGQSAPLTGRQIGHYQVIDLIGRGGMGEVYLAQDGRLGRKVALKLLPAKFAADADRVRRFEQEARSASALNHPNVIVIFEIGAADGAHYIATEYVAGQTLRQMMAGERMSFGAALSVATQVANALAEAHKAGVLHRDIKPENLMVRPDGVVKVLDFGLAKLLDRRPEFANDAGGSSSEALKKGRDAFEQAIKLDPNYAAAWVGVANCWTVMGQIDAAHQSDAITHAKAAITRALELDESLVEAHAALALIKTQHEWDWEGAEREYRRALALDANYAPGWHWYAMRLSLVGRHDEAINAIRRAEELDPVSLVINCNHGWILWCARRNDEAIAQLRKTIDLDPYFANAHDKLANMYETTGQYAEAVEQRAPGSDLSGAKPEVGAGMRAAYRRGGWQEFARREVGRLQRELQARYHNPKYLALAWARLGDKDRALEWLKRGYAERSEAMLYLKVDPRYDGLRDDPRFVDLLRRMRFSP